MVNHDKALERGATTVAKKVHFIVATCEYMISGTEMRPEDVVITSNLKTIESSQTPKPWMLLPLTLFGIELFPYQRWFLLYRSCSRSQVQQHQVLLSIGCL